MNWSDLKKKGSKHYKTGGVEPIDLIRDLGILRPFALGSIIKYAARNCGRHLRQSDLEKIVHYVEMLMEGGEKREGLSAEGTSNLGDDSRGES